MSPEPDYKQAYETLRAMSDCLSAVIEGRCPACKKPKVADTCEHCGHWAVRPSEPMPSPFAR